MLCQFPLYSKVNQLQLYTYPLSPEPPLSHSTSQVIPEHQAEFSVLYSNFSLVIYFNMVVYIFQCCSLSSSYLLFLPLPAMSMSLVCTSASLYLSCKQLHQYRFSSFHINVLSAQSLSHGLLFVILYGLQPTRLLCQTILEWVVIPFSRRSSRPTEGSNPSLLHWQGDSLPLNHL